MLGFGQDAFSLPRADHLSRVLKTPLYNIQQAENFGDRTREQPQRDTNLTNCPAHPTLAPALVNTTVNKAVVVIED